MNLSTEKIMTPDNIKFPENIVRYFSAVFSGVIALLTSFLIIFSFDSPDLSIYEDLLLPQTLENCLPENDLVAYAAFVVMFPVCYVLFMHIFRRLFGDFSPLKFAKLSRSVDFLWSCAASFATLAFVAIIYIHPYYATRYFYGRERIWLVLICALFLFAFCFACSRGKFRTANEIAAVIIGVAFLLFVLYAMGKHNYMYSYTSYNIHHYSAWWFPIYKVGSGLTLGEGFNELYGFYPYLIVPVLKLFGGVNQESLSLYIAIVFTFMAACLLFFCNRFFKNKLLGTFCAIGFFAIGPMIRFCNTELYFQYYPARALFVFAALGLIALYCSVKKFRGLLMVGGTVMCAFALVWNTESGLVTTIVWAGFLILDKAIEHRLNNKELLKRILLAVLSSVASVVLFVATVEIITYVRAGIFLSADDILFGIVTFSDMGFFMLPLEPGIWFAVAFALVYGLYVSVPYLALARKKGDTAVEDRDFAVAMFMTTVAGIGSFMYFMGRSFPTNCMTFMAWTVMICTLLADRNIIDFSQLLTLRKKSKSEVPFIKILSCLLRNIACFVVAGVSFCGALVMVGNALDSDSKVNTRFNTEQPAFAQSAEQIKKWAEEECGGEIPYILHTNGAFIQELMGVPSRENVYEQINWFRYSDAYTYIDFINSHSESPFVIDKTAVTNLKNFFPEDWAAIEQNFEVRGSACYNYYMNEDVPYECYLYVPKSFLYINIT